MDSQSIEVVGRNRLISELVLAGLEVALPVRDRGVDIVAYIDLAVDTSNFVAVPIQMKAASKASFSVNRKYEKVSNLIIAYVWGLQSQDHVETYALTYPEAFLIAEAMGWTKTASWEKGYYVNGQPGKKLCSLLAPYRMTPLAWREKVAQVSGATFQLEAT